VGVTITAQSARGIVNVSATALLMYCHTNSTNQDIELNENHYKISNWSTVFMKGFRKLRYAFPISCSKLNTIFTTFFPLHKTQCNYLSQYAPEPDTRWPSTDARLASKLLHSSCPCLWVCKCLACWTRLLPVTLSGDCEIVALRQRPAKSSSRDPQMLNCKLQAANGERGLNFVGNINCGYGRD